MQLNYPKIIKLNRIIKKTKEKGVFEMRTEQSSKAVISRSYEGRWLQGQEAA
jgi:hypothetical protein